MQCPDSRFIPAGAGNTCPRPRLYFNPAVYPRWRGEHAMDQGITLDGGGLSPLARGTHSHGDRRRTVDRFIPAGAGNTNGDSLARSSFAVYSRWRGEHLTLAENGFSVRGLSPLARGTPQRYFAQFRPRRFIPAGAGNTRAVAVVFAAKQVYPRWRGEHHK